MGHRRIRNSSLGWRSRSRERERESRTGSVEEICGSADQAWLPLTRWFLSAEQGKVLKVVHTSEGVFTISQYSLFHNKGPVLNMAIDSQKVSDP